MTGLSERFHDALTYAARLHARQKRKQTSIPCVSHLLAVERSGAPDGAANHTNRHRIAPAVKTAELVLDRRPDHDNQVSTF